MSAKSWGRLLAQGVGKYNLDFGSAYVKFYMQESWKESCSPLTNSHIWAEDVYA